MSQLIRNTNASGETLVRALPDFPGRDQSSSVSDINFHKWWTTRLELQDGISFSGPDGHRVESETHHFRIMIRLFNLGIKYSGFLLMGYRNALDVRLRPLELSFPDLPREFDGYRILHLTDLHLDALPELASAIVKSVKGCSVDLCVMTGDYITDEEGPFEHVLEPLAEIVSHIETRDGFIATLGNHDTADMPAAFTRLGIRVLINETIRVRRKGAEIHLTGLDDVNCFYTPAAETALESGPDGFSLALVHSPEMADVAASNGYALYLCGHTHGGQVCLPGGRVVISRLVRNKPYASGLWRCGDMLGYTSPGAGVSGAPVRFFSRGEATLVTLRRQKN